MFRRWIAACLAVATCCQAVRIADAETFQLRAQRGPYYVGEPVVVRLVAEGLTPGEQPDCRLQDEPPAALVVEGPRVNVSTRSYTQIINGRMSRSESVDYGFNFVVTAREEGEFMIGPFQVDYEGTSRVVQGKTFRFRQLENDPDMRIELSLPQETFYVGQRIPVTIRWAFAGELEAVRYAFSNLQIRSPLFDQFTFQDPRSTARTTMTIATAKGAVQIDAEVTQEQEDGREFIVVTGRRTMLADQVGDFDAIPVTCRTEKVTAWGRDLFGDLRARRTSPALAAGEPLHFSIRPLPTEGRPDSFAGAVGTGFSMDVSANRTVVRVGDPISLTISLQGAGNLENASLPPLSAGGGMPPERFQVPSEQPAGTFDGQTRQFKVHVRVKDESVDQIPALAFAWFDPEKEKYESTRSKPIALQVMPAQVVSAEDVVAAEPPAAEPSQATGPNGPSVARGSGSTIALQGANLAVERDPATLLADQSRLASGWALRVGPYLAGVAAILAAGWMRRRADVDPEIFHRKRNFQRCRKQIVAAGGSPPREAAQRIADALRNISVRCDPVDRSRLSDLVRECETLVYAPDASDPQVSVEGLVSRATTAVDELGTGARGV